MTISPVPPSIPALLRVGLTDDEDRLVTRLSNYLGVCQASNTLKLAYFEGEQRVRRMGISIPPNMAQIQIVVGWPGTTVEVIEERLDWYGWRATDDDYGLSQIYSANQLNLDSSKAHTDALIYGTGFAAVGSGDDGEPDPLITIHSPQTTTGLWNRRRRRLDAALTIMATGPASAEMTLYLPDQTIRAERNITDPWRVIDRDQHNLDRVLAVQLENRPRNGVAGRSEISKAVRSYTDQAVRTMLGMEVHREFYQAPQRWVMGVDESSFTDAEGNVRTGWESIMGRMLAMPRDDDGNVPTVGQFTPASPAPYLDQVRGLAQLLAAEAAIPPSYLGFQTDNPASADAIQRSEARLVKRAERRQASFGASWLEVGRLALLVRDGEIPSDFDQRVSTKWRDASTPTRSAAADEAVKLVAAGILLPDSSVTYDRIGLDPDEQAQLAADKRRNSGSLALRALTDRVALTAAPEPEQPVEVPGAGDDTAS